MDAGTRTRYWLGIGLRVHNPAKSVDCEATSLVLGIDIAAEMQVALRLLSMDTRANPNSLPGTGCYTMAIVQNTSDTPANVRVTAKPKQGSTGGGVATFTIDCASSKVVRPDNHSDTNHPIPATTEVRIQTMGTTATSVNVGYTCRTSGTDNATYEFHDLQPDPTPIPGDQAPVLG